MNHRHIAIPQEVKFTAPQGRYVAELLQGYLEGQVKRYRAKHINQVYDYSDAQILAKICDRSTPSHHKVAEVAGAYERIVREFQLVDEANLLEI